MKKALIALVVLGAAGFAGWWFFLRAKGMPPAVATQLEASQTAGFLAIESPELLATELASAVTRMTAKAPAEIKAVASPDAVAQQLKFDPRKAEGWQGIGVDPTAGLAMVTDVRLKGEPVVLLGLADQAKFLSWIEKIQGSAPKLEEGTPGVLTIGERRYFVGKRGALTAVMPAKDALKADFQAFLGGSGASLASADHFKPAFRDAAAGARASAWLDSAVLASIAQGGEEKQVASFYAGLFPGIALYAGAEQGGMRVLATEKGAEALRQVLMPAASAPKFSAFIPAEGWAALRASVNLKEVFTGIEALLPPTVPGEVKSQLGMARLAVAMVLGVSWDDLAEAFGGHVVVAGKLDSLAGGAPEWLALISATAKADGVIDSLVGKAQEMVGGFGAEKLPLEKVTLAGVAARQAQVGPLTVVAGRVDDVLVIASSPKTFEEAVARKGGSGSLKGTHGADALDGEVVYGVVLDFAAAKSLAGRMGGEQAAAVIGTLDPGRPHAAFSLGLDRYGLVSKGDGFWSLGAAVGLGGFSAPMFLMAHRVKAVDEARAFPEPAIAEPVPAEPKVAEPVPAEPVPAEPAPTEQAPAGDGDDAADPE